MNPDAHHLDSNVRPAVGVGVMIVRNSKVLLSIRRGAHGAGTYGWPGGGLAFNEKLEDAVKREALEETGIIVLKSRLLCVSNIREYGRHYIDFEFIVEESTGEPVRREEDFAERWNWFPLNALPSPLFKPCELALHSLQTGILLNDP